MPARKIAAAVICCALLGGCQSDWTIIEDKDPISDARRVEATTQSESGERLVVECRAGDPRIFIGVEARFRILGRDEWRMMTYRIDDGPALREAALFTGDSAIINPGLARPVWERMRNGSRMTIRYAAHDSDRDAIFDIRGADAVNEALARTCPPVSATGSQPRGG